MFKSLKTSLLHYNNVALAVASDLFLFELSYYKPTRVLVNIGISLVAYLKDSGMDYV